MPDPATLRDSTQILLPADALDDLDGDVACAFTVSVVESGDTVRIIGSPVVIKDVSDYLARHGVNVQ
jgi:hypothetical protein